MCVPPEGKMSTWRQDVCTSRRQDEYAEAGRVYLKAGCVPEGMMSTWRQAMCT